MIEPAKLDTPYPLTCSRCGGTGPFTRRTSIPRGYAYACKECTKARNALLNASKPKPPKPEPVYEPKGGKRIDNAVLRDAFLRTGRTATEVARAAGWLRADTQRVRHSLGLGSGRATVSYDNAVTLCHAMGVDPVEVGL